MKSLKAQIRKRRIKKQANKRRNNSPHDKKAALQRVPSLLELMKMNYKAKQEKDNERKWRDLTVAQEAGQTVEGKETDESNQVVTGDLSQAAET